MMKLTNLAQILASGVAVWCLCGAINVIADDFGTSHAENTRPASLSEAMIINEDRSHIFSSRSPDELTVAESHRWVRDQTGRSPEIATRRISRRYPV